MQYLIYLLLLSKRHATNRYDNLNTHLHMIYLQFNHIFESLKYK